MTVFKLMTDKTSDGVGTLFTNASTMAIYSIALKGTLGGGFISVMFDANGGSDFVRVGELSSNNPAKLILLPAGASCNVKLTGATKFTKVTVEAAS